jgi:hypothetical protein
METLEVRHAEAARSGAVQRNDAAGECDAELVGDLAGAVGD